MKLDPAGEHMPAATRKRSARDYGSLHVTTTSPFPNVQNGYVVAFRSSSLMYIQRSAFAET